MSAEEKDNVWQMFKSGSSLREVGQAYKAVDYQMITKMKARFDTFYSKAETKDLDRKMNAWRALQKGNSKRMSPQDVHKKARTICEYTRPPEMLFWWVKEFLKHQEDLAGSTGSRTRQERAQESLKKTESEAEIENCQESERNVTLDSTVGDNQTGSNVQTTVPVDSASTSSNGFAKPHPPPSFSSQQTKSKEAVSSLRELTSVKVSIALRKWCKIKKQQGERINDKELQEVTAFYHKRILTKLEGLKFDDKWIKHWKKENDSFPFHQDKRSKVSRSMARSAAFSATSSVADFSDDGTLRG